MSDKLIKAAVGVAVLPVDVASDIVTLGGTLTDDESATAKRIKHISDNIDEVTK